MHSAFFFSPFVATPRHIDYERVLEDLSGIDGVMHAHSLHIWSLTTNKITLSAHLVLGMAFLPS